MVPYSSVNPHFGTTTIHIDCSAYGSPRSWDQQLVHRCDANTMSIRTTPKTFGVGGWGWVQGGCCGGRLDQRSSWGLHFGCCASNARQPRSLDPEGPKYLTVEHLAAESPMGPFTHRYPCDCRIRQAPTVKGLDPVTCQGPIGRTSESWCLLEKSLPTLSTALCRVGAFGRGPCHTSFERLHFLWALALPV